ncbi:MAG: magnesium and cobalt transport protein CorA [Gemmatimonadetes bacterium]|nr:MAG: magnesium and cobalt transport protein CorA [Gemmatimonadota bacterium]
MGRRFRKTQRKIGLPPGSLRYTGDRADGPSEVRVVRYGPDGGFEEGVLAPGEQPPAPRDTGVLWIDQVGVHDVERIAEIGRTLGVHPLLLEDAVNVAQRPKVAEVDGRVMLVLRSLRLGEGRSVRREQVSLVLGPGFVWTLQEVPEDCFDFVRARLREGKGRLRGSGPDYLWYALLDAIVDAYLPVLDDLIERVEDLDEAVLTDLRRDVPREVKDLRAEAISLRRALMPLREALDRLLLEPPDLVRPETLPFLHDVLDHVRQDIDLNESVRDLTGTILDTYASMLSLRTNDVMKVLTLVATIFIPITFIAGVYGMNFQYMPELAVRWAYPAVWAVMLGVVAGMLWYFRRRGWL